MLRAGVVAADNQSWAVTQEKAAEYARWLTTYGSTDVDPDSLSTTWRDLSRLADVYSGTDASVSIMASIPGKGVEVRTQLTRSAQQLESGEQALEKRQYGQAQDLFASATTALDQLKTPLRQDLLAVERTDAIRMTEHGAVSRGTHTTVATINHWVDGDTVDTSQGRVRVIGIDTPELDEQCGPARAAKEAASQLALPGQTVRLVNPDSVQDTDKYHRLLRFVDVAPTASGPATVDVGYSLLLNDLAEPRYDSLDGYQWHPRESAYRGTRAKPATGTSSGCTMPEEHGLLAPASVLATEKGEDEYSRSRILDELIPHLPASAEKTLSSSVLATARSDAKADAARRVKAEAAQRAKSEAKQAKAAQARRKREQARRQQLKKSAPHPTTKAKKSGSPSTKKKTAKSTGSTTSSKPSGGSSSTYTGPRCYAPGGKTWKKC